MTADDAGSDDAAESVADRLRYAPDLVDEERVLATLSASNPAERATVATAIGAMPVEHAGRLVGAVPILAESIDEADAGDVEPFLAALGRIAAADPAAVRPVAGRLVDHLTAADEAASGSAAAALQRVIAAVPAERDRVEPLLEHDDERVGARAASVLAAATATDPEAASGLLETCARVVARNPTARHDATAVLARAGWLDPAALDPAVDTLVSVVRNNDAAPTMRGGGSGAVDDAGSLRLALVALGHVAGHDPAAVQSLVPVCVALSTDEDEGVRAAAARLLVTVALQESATAVSLRDFAGTASYFDRTATLEALADASAGLPGRETLFLEFVADENAFIRAGAYRQIAPV